MADRPPRVSAGAIRTLARRPVVRRATPQARTAATLASTVASTVASGPVVSAGPLIAQPVFEPVIPTLDPNLGFDALDDLSAIRAEDLFNGVFRFHNFHRNRVTKTAVRVDPEQPAFLTLDLPGQHMGEEVVAEGATISPPLRARLAGRSRLAVRMPAGATGVTLTIPALLQALAEWPLEVDPLARYRSGGVTIQMLEGVRDTFSFLGFSLLLELVHNGLLSIASIAATRASALADAAYAALLANRGYSAIAIAAQDIRDDVEEAGDEIAQRARDAISGTTDEEREIAEAAESLLEVYFARMLAERILDGDTQFGILLYQMSGLFDLMMHPHRPARTATALELPYRLLTSPSYWSRFTHAAHPASVALEGGTRSEIWHTRLLRRAGAFTTEIPPEGVDYFAMWTPDYDLETELPDFPMSLTAEWRRQIVKRTTGHNEEKPDGTPYEPVPAKVRRLELSPLGAALDLAIDWPDEGHLYPDFGALIGWQHKIALGRDQKVRIAEAGWLYPFGIKCTKVTLTERKFRQGGGQRLAPLIQKVFLLIDNQPLSFPAEGQAFGGRALPFRRLQAVTETTPTLDTANAAIPNTPDAERIRVGGKPLQIEFLAKDSQGREIGFKLPQFFLPSTFPEEPAWKMTALASAWTTASHRARLSGQTMRVVPDADAALDMAIDRLALSATQVEGNVIAALEAGKRPFHPRMDFATATIPGVAEMTGLGDDFARRIEYTGTYLDDAWQGAKRRVVLEIKDAVDLDFAADLSSDAMGAIGQASQRLSAIAEGLGPVPLPDPARLQQLIAGTLDWRDLLPEFRVLGRFLLERFLETLIGRDIDLPTFTTRRTQHEVVREWVLRERITRSVSEAGVVVAPRGNSEIFLQTLVRATLHGIEGTVTGGGAAAELAVPTGLSDPGAEAHGHLTNLDITLFELIQVRFDEIAFDAVAGRKPETRITMNANPMEFMGPLEFLNVLKDLIPPAGFGDGPRIVPGPLGIEAMFDLGLPNTEVGVLALKNMTLGARSTLPFDQRPLELSFYFNERHRPFEVAVAGFAGGGFFALSVDAGGIREIEAALEFGASASLNLGVASGSVSIKGGVYFRYAAGDVVLEGYVEMRGRLSVLALISASLLFHMALAYEKRGGRAYVRGEATLRVDVEVLFFSTSVTLHVERTFEAGEADPRFADTMAAQDWLDYCGAYA